MFLATDLVIILVIVFSMLVGVIRGFVREAWSLTAWVSAIFGAMYFHETIAQYLKPYLQSSQIRNVISFVICFVVVLLICSFVGSLMSKWIKQTSLSGTDRTLGLLFGLARGGLLVSMVLVVFTFTALKEAPFWQRSILLPYFSPAMVWLNSNVPERFKKIETVLMPPQLKSKEHSSADVNEIMLNHLPVITQLTKG